MPLASARECAPTDRPSALEVDRARLLLSIDPVQGREKQRRSRSGPAGRPGTAGSGGRAVATTPESRQAATAAGLHYVSDSQPGIHRRMGRLGFEYSDPRGRRIRDRARLKRIAALAIPPAWEDVWIC